MIKLIILIILLYILYRELCKVGEHFEQNIFQYNIPPRKQREIYFYPEEPVKEIIAHEHVVSDYNNGNIHFNQPPPLHNIYIDTDWINQGIIGYGDYHPAGYLTKMVRELGPPDIFDPSPGGTAIWKHSTLKKRNYGIMSRIEIRDENVPHTFPFPHTDYLYGSSYISVPTKLIPQILELSEGVSYDALKKIVTVKCHDLGVIIVTLALCCMIARSEITLESIQHRGLYEESLESVDKNSASYDENSLDRFKKVLSSCVRESMINNVSLTDGDVFMIPSVDNNKTLGIKKEEKEN